MKLIYLIKFSGHSFPEKIVADNFQELMIAIENAVVRHGKSFEWLIEEYD